MKRLLFLLTFKVFALQIDVVVPIHEKDKDRIENLLINLREKVVDIGEIYFISKENYSEDAIWIDEALFPFTLDDVGNELGGKGGVGKHNRRGWYFQQVLKFYAPSIIEGISDYILVFDADTLITRPTRFIDEENRIYLNIEARGPSIPLYYSHMQLLFPELVAVDRSINPVVNHALFSKVIIEDLISKVEERFNLPFWKVFLNSVNTVKYGLYSRGFNVGASEYLIYYYFCMYYHPEKVTSRVIKISNKVTTMSNLEVSDYFDFKTIHNLNP